MRGIPPPTFRRRAGSPPAHSLHWAALAIAAFLLLPSGQARAARFFIKSDTPVMYVGESVQLLVELEPSPGETIYGGEIEMNADLNSAMFSDSQDGYRSNMPDVDLTLFPASGTIRFKGSGQQKIEAAEPFLSVDVTLLQEGASYVSLSGSYALDPEGTRRASVNPSIYKMFANPPGSFNPFMFAALETENKRTQGAPGLNLSALQKRDNSVGGLDIFAGGLLGEETEIEDVQSAQEADVVVAFSKSSVKVGKDQHIRLDIVIEKFPTHTAFIGGQFHVKYDPEYLLYVDKSGNARSTVELQKPYDLSFLSEGGRNVDKEHGIMNVFAAAPINVKDEELPKAPLTLAVMYFKAKMAGTTTVEILKDDYIKFPPFEKLKMKRSSTSVNIVSGKPDCDQGLPGTLCAGSIDITGSETVTFTTLASKGSSTQNQKTAAPQKVQTQTIVNVKSRFSNGLRMEGNVTDQPNSRGRMDFLFETADAAFNVGDFNTSLSDTKLTRMSGSKVTGIQVKYKLTPDLQFAAIKSQRRSTVTTVEKTGNDTAGPYPLGGSGMIVIGSLNVLINNRPAEEGKDYSVDYFSRQVTFKRVLIKGAGAVKGDQFTATFETASDFFSTGNVGGFRMNWAPEKRPIHIGATLLQSQAPATRENVEIAVRETGIAIEDGLSEPGGCPENTGAATTKFTAILKLHHKYIIKGSVSIPNVTEALGPCDTSGQYYFDYYDYANGTIHWRDKTTSQTLVKVDVSYQYYDRMQENVVNIIEKDSMDPTKFSFNPQLFVGSEKIYLTNNESTESPNGPDDIQLCHAKNDDLTVKETDDYSEDPCDPLRSQIVYKKGTENDYYFLFSDPPKEAISGKTSVKIVYALIPATLDEISAFDKNILGFDAGFKKGRFSASAEYASTESDIGSKLFDVNNEQLIIDLGPSAEKKFDDALKKNSNGDNLIDYWKYSEYNVNLDPQYSYHLAPGRFPCNYTPNKDAAQNFIGGGAIACFMKNNLISGSVTAIRADNKEEVKMLALDADRGVIVFEVDKYPVGFDQTSDPDPNENLRPGTILELSYRHHPPQEGVVQGHALLADAQYAGSRVTAKMALDDRNTFFSSLGAGTGRGAQVTRNLNSDLTVNNLLLGVPVLQHALHGVDYAVNRTQTTTANDIYETTSGNRDSIVQTFKMNTKRIKNITYTTNVVKYVNPLPTAPQDNRDTNTGYGFSVPIIKNKLNVTVSRSDRELYDNIKGAMQQEATVKGYQADLKLSVKTDLSYTLNETVAAPATGTKTFTTNTGFTLKFKPTHYFDVVARSSRNQTETESPTAGRRTTTMDISDDYMFNFIDFGRITKPTFTWGIKERPEAAGSTGSRNENTRLAFIVDLLKNRLQLTPEFSTQKSSQTGGTASDNRIDKWTLTYKPKWKWFQLFTLMNTHNSRENGTVTTEGIKNTTGSSDTNRAYKFSFQPMPLLTWNLDFNRSYNPATPSKSFSSNLSYSFNTRMQMSTTYSSQEQNAKSSNKNMNMQLNYKITPTTGFNLQFTRNRSEAQTGINSSSSLQSRFQKQF